MHPRCDDDGVGPPVARNEVTADQAADLLGVRLQTIYAYVSRGLLTRSVPDQRGGPPGLGPRPRRGPAAGGGADAGADRFARGARRDGRDAARPEGHPVVPRARRRGARVEPVRGGRGARLGGPGGRRRGSRSTATSRSSARRRRPWRAGATDTDRIRAAVLALATDDPDRGDLKPDHVVAVGRRAVVGGVVALGGEGGGTRRRPAVGRPRRAGAIPTRGSPPSTPRSCC